MTDAPEVRTPSPKFQVGWPAASADQVSSVEADMAIVWFVEPVAGTFTAVKPGGATSNAAAWISCPAVQVTTALP